MGHSVIRAVDEQSVPNRLRHPDAAGTALDGVVAWV
jgi:hypothetical protein